jgi:type IV pilus assembly protein PilY1
MGLMAYQQNAQALVNLHNSPYDASFDPANYDPAHTEDRDSPKKRYRVPNVSNPGNFVYYNIALPFYASPNYGNAYCYSVTADFDNGTEVYPGGPWDNYRCFNNKTSTSDTLPTWGDGASETAQGFTSYWFGGGFSPTDSDLAQNLLDFGSFLTWDWVSLTWYVNTSPGRGYLHTPVADLDTAQAAALNLKLATSQFVTNAPTDASKPLQNAGLTPLEGTLLTAKDYYAGVALPADEGGPASTPPLSCDKDFIALLTDGLPSTDSGGTVVTDPAVGLAAVANAAAALKTNDVETYVIGFALPFGTDPDALDTIAASGGTTDAYSASDTATLKTAFDAIFTDILAKTGASSSAATNSTSLSANSVVYQARFNSGDWSGQLLAKSISTAGIISGTADWDAGTLLKAKAAGDRKIITFGLDTNDGIPFRWSDINALADTSAKDTLNADYLGTADGLGSDRVDFLRGGTGGASAALFRDDREGKLGDIIHSTPQYVGPPSAGYNDLEFSGYSSFASSQSGRTKVIYSGANDGMLHAFSVATGEELLAYIPGEVFPNLSRLTALGYGTSVSHQYFVDGSPLVADAKVSSTWKTVLAGGLMAGGQGVYALDITSPSTFSEANADNIVLWEFTDEDDADLGYTYFQPTDNLLTNQSAQIAKMANGKWAVILGNGYNNSEADGNASTTGNAYLYILFLDGGLNGTWTEGTDYIKIDTGKGSVATPNGLATPTPIDMDGDGDVDKIYAGDLQGNMWKFDVSDSSTGGWGLALTANKPLYSGSSSKPITTAPVITVHPYGGFMVSFGTGKYMELSDTASTGTQAIYGIWDEDANVNGTGSLVEQEVIELQTHSGIEYRVNTDKEVNYDSKKGWYFDLPESGERMDVNPIIRNGRFVFVTRTPSNTPCEAGGTSWLMEFNYLTGGRLDVSPFDVDSDGVIDESDYVTINVDGDDINVPVTGTRTPTGGLIATPTVLKDNFEREFKIIASSTGDLTSVKESVDASYSGRLSWEEVE